MARTRKFEFEKSLAQLEELVELLEGGDLSLEDSLKAFERGIKLTRECQEALQSAEQRVRILIENREQEPGETGLAPFALDDEDDR